LSPVQLERYAAQFDLDPEEIQAIAQQQSSLSEYKGDPRFEQSQIDALSNISEIARGGITDADKAAMEESQLEAGIADRGRQEAVLQSMARRGMSGSGSELAASLSSAQAASGSAAADQRAMVQGAQQRALQAMIQQGSLAGNIRGQGFGEAERRAGAEDIINRFNIQNARGVEATNVGARNRAQLLTERNRQRIADKNVGVSQSQALQPNELAQQGFTNRLNVERTAKGLGQELPTASTAMRTAEIASGLQQNKQYADIAGTAAGMGYKELTSDEDPSGYLKGEPVYG
jgi:hypothetical protein